QPLHEFVARQLLLAEPVEERSHPLARHFGNLVETQLPVPIAIPKLKQLGRIGSTAASGPTDGLGGSDFQVIRAKRFEKLLLRQLTALLLSGDAQQTFEKSFLVFRDLIRGQRAIAVPVQLTKELRGVLWRRLFVVGDSQT